MNNIQNSNICKPTILNKTLVGFTCVLTVSAIALLIIGLIAPKGNPFNAISQLGVTNNGLLLGTSIFLLILDLVWLGAIKKNSDKATIEAAKFTKDPVLINKRLPNVIDLKILSYMSPETLAATSCVNKSWQVLTNDKLLWKAFKLKKLFPKLTIINEKFWEREPFASLGLSARDIKPIDGTDKRAMIPVIQKLLPRVEGDLGVTILTIPKGLTFNHLVTLAESLIEQHGTIFRYIWQNFRDTYGNIPIDATYRVILTNNVFKDTRNKSPKAQKDHVDKLGIGCDFPKVIEMVTLLIGTFLKTKNHHRLFNDHPWTYSRCREILGGWQMVVGGFLAASGFVVNSYFGVEVSGLAGRREFFPGIGT